MFTIRSKVQNAIPTPIPSYTSNNRRRPRNHDNSNHQNEDNQNASRVSLDRASTVRRRRKKKRRASEVVNINDYPSAKRFMFVFIIKPY